jgi:hypothetical protein
VSGLAVPTSDAPHLAAERLAAARVGTGREVDGAPAGGGLLCVLLVEAGVCAGGSDEERSVASREKEKCARGRLNVDAHAARV